MRLTRYPGLFFGLVLVLLIQLALSLPAQAQPLRVTLGTATPGGGFQLFGRHLVEVLNAHSTAIQLEEQPTRGSRQNLTLLEKGAIDIGQVEGNAARVALEGIDRDPANLKVLTVMYPNPGMFVVRAELALSQHRRSQRQIHCLWHPRLRFADSGRRCARRSGAQPRSGL